MVDNIGTRSKNMSKDYQMKTKLHEMGLYEDGMSHEEMDQLLKALDSSKQDTSTGSILPPTVTINENKSVQRQTSVEYEDHTPSINQRTRDQKTPDQNVQRSHLTTTVVTDSDEDIFERSSTTSRNREKNDDNNIKNQQQLNPGKSYSNIVQLKNVNNRTMRMLSKVDNTQADFWNMNPLDDLNVEYVPMLPLRSKIPPAESTKIYFDNDQKSIIPHDELAKIRKQLNDVIDAWQKWDLESSDEPEFQWGAPIQAQSESYERPLHRYETRVRPSTPNPKDDNLSDEAVDFMPGLNNDNIQRSVSNVTRRQTVKQLDPFAYKDDNQDEDDQTFESKAKRLKSNSINSVFRSQPPLKRKGLGPGASHQKKTISDDENDDVWLGGNKKNDKNLNKSVDDDINIDEISDNDYIPRRIPPPTKSRQAAIRGRKQIGKSRNQLAIQKKIYQKEIIEEMDITESSHQRNTPLTPEEIADLVNSTIDCNDEQSDETSSPKKDDQDTKFLAAKSLIGANRLNISLIKLQDKQNTKKAMDKKIQEAKNLQEKKEEAIRREKIEARIARDNNIKSKKEENERMKKEKEEKYRQRMQKVNTTSERIELKSDGDTIRPVDTLSWDPKANAKPPSVNRTPVSNQSNKKSKVNCPICNKLFPEAEVQAHASACNEFLLDSEQISDDEEDLERTPPPPNVCSNCNNYSTNNIKDFANHQHKCNFSKHSRNNEASGSDPSSPITVSDSPIRSFKPISQIENADVFKNQFKPKQPSGRNPNILGNRKRKR